MKNLVLFFLFLFSHHLLQGQTTTCPDNFKAYNQAGQEVTTFCVGQPIRFRSCLPNTQPDKEYYDVDKSNNVAFPDTSKVTTYTRAGTYVVTQLVNILGVVSQKERTFLVIDTPPPVFTVTACAQNQVKVTLTDKVYDNFIIDFNDGTTRNGSRGASVLHQYATSGPFKIKVTGAFTGSSCTGQSEMSVNALPAPVAPVLENIRVTRAGPSGSLTLSIKNLQPEYFYIMERVTGTTTTLIDTLKNPATSTRTYNLTNQNTTGALCLQLRITDKCGSNLNLTPGNICSQPLIASTGNNAINLNWPAYPETGNILAFELLRNGTLLQTLPGSVTSFTDSQVRCNEKYCYGLKAVLRNNLYSQSADTCVTAITNTLPPAGVLTSTFTPGNQVELTFSIPGNLPATRITYQKSQENAPFATLTTSDKLNITDNNLNLATGSFCYQAFYEDACGKTAPVSNRTCPVILRATLGPNGTINLNWTNYQGFEPANTNYQVERLSENGTVISSTPVTGNSFTERVNATDQQLFYRIKVVTANPAVFSFSNTQLLRQESSFQIPTAFSPNGDNLNDRFEIKGKIFGTFRLSVFDRWGQEIFRSTNPAEGWDGNIRGRAAPVGVYVYSLTATDTTGKQIAKTGTVTLVR